MRAVAILSLVPITILLLGRAARSMTTTCSDGATRALRQRKAAFLGPGVEPFAVALGNSAGDLDSVATALAAAHLAEGVAVARFPRKDLALRKDVSLALKAAPGAEDALVFLDELGADVAQRRAGCSLTLTDHNRFDAQHLGLKDPKVVAVVDHHRDEGQHLDAAREVDDAAGSCSSLLAERVLAAGPDQGLLCLLLAAQAVDCRGFAEAFRGQKFGPRDVAAAHAVLDALGGASEDRSEEALRARAVPAACGFPGTVPALAKALAAARHDVSGLDAHQLLGLDYKQVGRVGAASILSTFDEFEEAAGGPEALEKAMRAFAVERECDVLFAMAKVDGDVRGVAYVVVAGTPDVKAVETGLEGAPGTLPADLKALPLFKEQDIVGVGFGCAFSDRAGVRFSPARAATSRKTLLPAILRFLGGDEG